MPLISRYFFSLVIAALLLSSCDDSNPTEQTQDIGNLVWRNNASLLAFAEQRNFVSAGSFVYKLHETDEAGRIGRQLLDEVTNEAVPSIAVSADGTAAVALIGSDLVKVILTNGSKIVLTSNVTKVYAISPDLKYAVITHAALFQPIKRVSLLDISGSPRSVAEWDIKGLTVNQGYWMNDAMIALNVDTASAPFINVYDTTGAVVKTFLGAQTPARSSDYEPSTNSLYVKHFTTLYRIDVGTGARTDIASSFINMDAQGNTLVYILNEESGKQRIYVQNVQSGETMPVADDVLRYVVLSPDATKLAYLVEPRAYFNEIKVIPLTTP
ncbi:MAG TPA: hypothetical protein VFH43_02960 [Candidatus Kapabacteria bacterium]|jgi:hypothetical protein|nr:hypothetical protein [Candidatus Kapabacteria bacterium]